MCIRVSILCTTTRSQGCTLLNPSRCDHQRHCRPMGNVQSGSTLTRTTGALDSFVAELGGDIIYDKRYTHITFVCHSITQVAPTKHCTVSLPQDRQMQTPQWLSRSQDIHQARSRNNPPSLCAKAERYAREHTRRSFRAVDPCVTPVDREALLDIPNVYNYQAFVETDKAGFLIRQWIASNLYDRIRRVLLASHTPHIHLHPARVPFCPPSKRNGSCSSCFAHSR